MGNIKTKELSKLGFTNDKARSLIINIISKHYKHKSPEEIKQTLINIKNNPNDYLEHEILSSLAQTLSGNVKERNYNYYELNKEVAPFLIFGKKEIDQNAIHQMENVMRLPISVSGALMPDAHHGFGVPIGGVLATKSSVIPYAVGVDIGCMMSLSIFEADENYCERNSYEIKNALKKWTHFGMNVGLPEIQNHDILDDNDFNLTRLLKQLHGKVRRQLGTSGSGNHFVEFGTASIESNNLINVPPGKYFACLSHSGSRGLGSGIAQHYIKVAMDRCRLPASVARLAWLDINSDAGVEYWRSMELAGRYATACHEVIHRNLSQELGLKVIHNISNHHNLAWKEKDAAGDEIVVHRKGATPAHKAQLGIIPGSMASQAFIVEGFGNESSINSASHGAGRAMSRQKAKENLTNSELKKLLLKQNIQLIGGNVSEGPAAYKDIDKVMSHQTELVKVIGKFFPSIVRMYKE